MADEPVIDVIDGGTGGPRARSSTSFGPSADKEAAEIAAEKAAREAEAAKAGSPKPTPTPGTPTPLKTNAEVVAEKLAAQDAAEKAAAEKVAAEKVATEAAAKKTAEETAKKAAEKPGLWSKLKNAVGLGEKAGEKTAEATVEKGAENVAKREGVGWLERIGLSTGEEVGFTALGVGGEGLTVLGLTASWPALAIGAAAGAVIYGGYKLYQHEKNMGNQLAATQQQIQALQKQIANGTSQQNQQSQGLTPELKARINPSWDGAKQIADLVKGPNGAKMVAGLPADMQLALGVDGSDPASLAKFKVKFPNLQDHTPGADKIWAKFFSDHPELATAIKNLAERLQKSDGETLANQAQEAIKNAYIQATPGADAGKLGPDGKPVAAVGNNADAFVASNQLIGMAGDAAALGALHKGLDGKPEYANILAALQKKPMDGPAEVSVYNAITGLNPDQMKVLNGAIKDASTAQTAAAEAEKAAEAARINDMATKFKELSEEVNTLKQGGGQQRQNGQRQNQQPNQQSDAVQQAMTERVTGSAIHLEALIISKPSHRLSLNPVNWFSPNHAYNSMMKQIQKQTAGDPQGFEELKTAADQLHAEIHGKNINTAQAKQSEENLGHVLVTRSFDESGQPLAHTPLLDGVDEVLNTQKDARYHIGTGQQALSHDANLGTMANFSGPAGQLSQQGVPGRTAPPAAGMSSADLAAMNAMVNPAPAGATNQAAMQQQQQLQPVG